MRLWGQGNQLYANNQWTISNNEVFLIVLGVTQQNAAMCLLFPNDSPLSSNPSSFSSQLLECIMNGDCHLPDRDNMENTRGSWASKSPLGVTQLGKNLHLSLANALATRFSHQEALMTMGLYIPGQSCLLRWHNGPKYSREGSAERLGTRILVRPNVHPQRRRLEGQGIPIEPWIWGSPIRKYKQICSLVNAALSGSVHATCGGWRDLWQKMIRTRRNTDGMAIAGN